MNRNTRGFTLTELLVATIVMGILGVALTSILVNDSRFVSKVEAMMSARQAARAAMNVMGTELQMVSGGGLIAATRTDIRVRAPYAFGTLCDRRWNGSRWIRYAVLVPTDSLWYKTAQANGLAWRGRSGDYTFMGVGGVGSAPDERSNFCTDSGIRLPDATYDGQFIRMRITDDTLVVGDVFYLYQDVRYRFSTSVDIEGRLGLWRQRSGDSWYELLAPFDPASEFRFYVGNSNTSQVAPPADLTTVTGLELRLVGASEVTPIGSASPPAFEIRTRVNFLNGR